jgi:hypothetical protein
VRWLDDIEADISTLCISSRQRRMDDNSNGAKAELKRAKKLEKE